MTDKRPWMIVAVLLAVAGTGAYFWLRQPPLEAPLPVTTAPVAPVVVMPPAVEVPPPILHPFDAAPPAQPLPSIDGSDAPLAQRLAGLLGAPLVAIAKVVFDRIVSLKPLGELLGR